MNMKRLRSIREDVLFVGPALFVFLLIVASSFIFGIYYSFTEWDGVSKQAVWIGLENYQYFFTQDPGVASSAWYTIRFTLTCTILSNVIGLFLIQSNG